MTRWHWQAACRENIFPRTCSRRTRTSITACRLGLSKIRRVPTPRKRAWKAPVSRRSSQNTDGVASLVFYFWVVAPPGIFGSRSSRPRRAERRDSLALLLRRSSQLLFLVLSGDFVIQLARGAGESRLFLRLLARPDFCRHLRPLGSRSALRSRRHVH